MSNDRIKLTLTRWDRDLILAHGYPFPGLRVVLEAVPNSKDRVVVRCDPFDVEHLLGDLAYSINHCADDLLQMQLNELYESIESETGL